jgi:hypothetical protein
MAVMQDRGSDGVFSYVAERLGHGQGLSIIHINPVPPTKLAAPNPIWILPGAGRANKLRYHRCFFERCLPCHPGFADAISSRAPAHEQNGRTPVTTGG